MNRMNGVNGMNIHSVHAWPFRRMNARSNVFPMGYVNPFTRSRRSRHFEGIVALAVALTEAWRAML